MHVILETGLLRLISHTSSETTTLSPTNASSEDNLSSNLPVILIIVPGYHCSNFPTGFLSASAIPQLWFITDHAMVFCIFTKFP